MTRVLIVDDQLAFRRQLHALLAHAGLEVVGEADDINAAEELARSQQPDLAIVDALLPGVSGLEGTPRLKAAAPQMRVILVSAYREHILKSSAQAVGAEDFVPKDELDLAMVLGWNKR